MLSPNYRWGQNFLTDRNVLDRIADLVVEPAGGDVLEIGPGPGALTVTLLNRGARVVALEIDARMVRLLSPLVEIHSDRLTVLEIDANNTSWASIEQQFGMAHPLTVSGNLPYYITAPLLAKLWEDPIHWDQAVFMVQKEVADRLVQEPGQRQSTALSVLLYFVATVQRTMNIAREAFYPMPEVDSSVIKLKKKSLPAVPFKKLQWVVRTAFGHRRKMLRQALSQGPGSPWGRQEWTMRLQSSGIDSTKRAEALNCDEWVKIAQMVPDEAMWK